MKKEKRKVAQTADTMHHDILPLLLRFFTRAEDDGVPKRCDASDFRGYDFVIVGQGYDQWVVEDHPRRFEGLLHLDTGLFSQEGWLIAQSICCYSDAFPRAEVPELIPSEIRKRSGVDVQFVLGFCGKERMRTGLD